jgi:catalase
MAKNGGFETQVGGGGETHQRIPKSGPHSGETHLTTNQGIRVSDNQNSLRSGARGPSLLEDFVLREKIFHFDHERIPERIVHARGSAAHGFFETYESFPILPAPICSNVRARRRLYSLVSRLSQGEPAPLTRRGMFVALP